MIVSGLTILSSGVERGVGQFAVETSTRVIIDLLGFRRWLAESIGEALARFAALRQQVRSQAAGFDLPCPVMSWLLLEAMRVPRRTLAWMLVYNSLSTL